MTTLKRDFGFSFASLFDTMIAARFLGRSEIGLAAVARDELGVALTKDSQKDDWSRRPLTPQQEAYALADVLHLVELRERLSEKLAAAGRLGWLEEECEAVARLEPARPQARPRGLPRGQGGPAPAAAGPRRAARAARLARAPGGGEGHARLSRSSATRRLLRLAELRPRDAAGLGAVPGVLPRLQRQAGELLVAVRRAEDLPESELPKVARSPRPVVEDAVRQRVERLKAWRARKGAELQLDISVVLPQRLIDRLAEARPRDAAGLAAVEGLRRWRVRGLRRGAAGRRIIGPP